jgi:hypothetical protein
MMMIGDNDVDVDDGDDHHHHHDFVKNVPWLDVA